MWWKSNFQIFTSWSREPPWALACPHSMLTNHDCNFLSQFLEHLNGHYPIQFSKSNSPLLRHVSGVHVYILYKNNFSKKEESLKLNKTWFPTLKNSKINKGTSNQSKIVEQQSSHQWCHTDTINKNKSQPLKMPVTNAGEMLGICSLRTWPTSPEYTMYIILNCL